MFDQLSFNNIGFQNCRSFNVKSNLLSQVSEINNEEHSTLSSKDKGINFLVFDLSGFK